MIIRLIIDYLRTSKAECLIALLIVKRHAASYQHIARDSSGA
jgi:hypothetical protein